MDIQMFLRTTSILSRFQVDRSVDSAKTIVPDAIQSVIEKKNSGEHFVDDDGLFRREHPFFNHPGHKKRFFFG